MNSPVENVDGAEVILAVLPVDRVNSTGHSRALNVLLLVLRIQRVRL